MNPSSKISLQELAARLGLAKSTVSMALRNDLRVSEATRKRVHAAAEKQGYVRDADLASLMSQIQSKHPQDYQANLAVLPISMTKVSLREIDGCLLRAAELGYKVEVMSDYQTYQDPVRVLRARGIQGVVFISWPLQEFPGNDVRLRRIAEVFPACITSSKPLEPRVNTVVSDAFVSVHIAMKALEKLGYFRPGILINPYLDRNQNKVYTGAFLAAQRDWPRKQWVEPAYCIEDPKKTITWLNKQRPDCLLTHDHTIYPDLQAAGFAIPAALGYAHLDLREEFQAQGISGIVQNHTAIGGAAVDMVVAQIRRAESGIPNIQKCIHIEPRWEAGSSTRKVHP